MPSPDARRAVTRALSERYQIVDHLGTGGFSDVYRVFDREREEHVALKLLRGLSPSSLYRFKREFRTMTELHHPNLVSLYELALADDGWFFTMELITGVDFLRYVAGGGSRPWGPEEETGKDESGEQAKRDLSVDWIPLDAFVDAATLVGGPRRGPWCDLERLRDAAGQLTQALFALHRMGVLHCDVKPSNVLVTSEGRVVVLDFGLVTLLGAGRSDRDAVVGSVPYVSPEAVRGAPLGPAADWYAVGVMLFEALTGERPFAGPPLRVLIDKVEQDAPAPRDCIQDVPEELDRLCHALLSRDPRDRPSARALRAHFSRESMLPSIAPPEPSAALVGRESELAFLDDLYERSARGCTVIARISGRSGLGKSALVEAFRAKAQREGALVLNSRCFAQEDVPYKALDPLVDSVVEALRSLDPTERAVLLPDDMDALARLFPVVRLLLPNAGEPNTAEPSAAEPSAEALSSAELQEARKRAFAAFRDLMRRLSRREPLVLHLDDLQWGDLDSVALLQDLLRPPAPPLLLLATFRSEDVGDSEFLRAFLASEDFPGEVEVRDLELEPLSEEEAGALAAKQLVEPSDEIVELVVREAHGIPFLIEQVAQHVNGARGSSQDISSWLGSGPTLGAVLNARFRALEESERRLLEIVAVANAPIDAQVVLRASAVTGGELNHLAIDKLVRITGAGEGKRIVVYHDKIREILMSSVEPGRLRGHHRELAEHLERVPGTDPERLMRHFRAAEVPDKAGRYAVAAAEHAFEALAFDRAAQLYRASLEIDPLAGVERATRLARLADVLACAGRSVEAAQEYLEAASLSKEPSQAFDMQRKAAEQLLQHGHVDDGLAVLKGISTEFGVRLPRTPRGALVSYLYHSARLRLRGLEIEERPEGTVDPRDLARIDFCWSIGTGLTMNNTLRGADVLTRGLILALDAGEPFRVARATALHVAYSGIGGSKSAAKTARLFAIAREYVERANHPHSNGLLSLAAGMSAYLEGRFPDGVRECARAEEQLRALPGTSWELTSAQAFGATSDVYCGNLRKLTGLVPERLRDAERRGNLYALATLRMSPASIYWLVVDQPEQAKHEIDAAISAWSKDGFQMEHYWELFARGQIDLYQGNARDAVRRLEARWTAFRRSLLTRIQFVNVQATHLRARCFLAAAADASGADREAYLEQVIADCARLRKHEVAWARGLASLLEAGVAFQRRDRERAVAELQRGIDVLDAVGVSLYAMAGRRVLSEVGDVADRDALATTAGRWLIAEGVARHDRFTGMLVPGFV